MAYKSTLTLSDNRKVDGYMHNEDLGLFLDDDKLWKGVHVRSGKFLTGYLGLWKQKKQCLAFVTYLADANMQWAVDTEEQFIEVNGGSVEVCRIYHEACEKGNEA